MNSSSSRALPSKERSQIFPERFKNRSKMEIIAALLEIARTPALKTHLMYRGNLSYFMSTYYVNLLSDAGLLQQIVDSKSMSKLFLTTPKGLKYLELYDSFQKIAGLDSDKRSSLSWNRSDG